MTITTEPIWTADDRPQLTAAAATVADLEAENAQLRQHLETANQTRRRVLDIVGDAVTCFGDTAALHRVRTRVEQLPESPTFPRRTR